MRPNPRAQTPRNKEHTVYIKMSGIELTGTLSWSRYWILKAFQLIVPCTELQLQTCPISLELKGDREGLNVHARGICVGKKFTATCCLMGGKLPEDNRWRNTFWIFNIKVTVDGQEKRFTELNLPGFPTNFEEKLCEFNLPSAI